MKYAKTRNNYAESITMLNNFAKMFDNYEKVITILQRNESLEK